MKQILIMCTMVIFGMAQVDAEEDVYKKFLSLKANAAEAQEGFYHSITNGRSNLLGKWTNENGRPIKCVYPFRRGGVTNVEYLVSMNAANTNVHEIVQMCQSGIVYNFHYSESHQLTRIEECGLRAGDFSFFDTGKDGDLESYCMVTNYFAAHGVRHYKKGEMVSEDNGLIDFSVFK